MKKVYYISTSIFPSKSANSIHTLNMIKALAESEVSLTVFVNRSSVKSNLINSINPNTKSISIKSIYNPIKRGIEFLNALNAVITFFFDIIKKNKPSFIISRNIFGALIFNLFTNVKVVYEFHIPEKKFRAFIQSLLLRSTKLKSITISEALKRIVINQYKLIKSDEIFVIHDAASERLDLSVSVASQIIENKIAKRDSSLKIMPRVGYFGHLYKGRGIELICELSLKRGDYNFFIFGGHDTDIAKLRKYNLPRNLFVMGHVPHTEVFSYMKQMDALLMPYQKKVSVGVKNIDTSEWMSPLKLFEYMSSKVPIISSDLPVLREILENKVNAILVDPNNVEEWSSALVSVMNDKHLANTISKNSYKKFIDNHTWKKRVEKIFELSDV